jgi:hypothetical protein
MYMMRQTSMVVNSDIFLFNLALYYVKRGNLTYPTENFVFWHIYAKLSRKISMKVLFYVYIKFSLHH